MKSFLPKILCLLIISILIIPEFVQAQATTFILVRHAEKVDDGTDDPALSEEGKQRVKDLTEHLKETGITAIYSTPYLRTRNTVASLAEQKGLTIKDYEPFNPNTLDQMLKKEQGGIVLISGHSNTTPFFVNALIGKDLYEQLDESDYDNIYIVTATEIGKGQVVHLLY